MTRAFFQKLLYCFFFFLSFYLCFKLVDGLKDEYLRDQISSYLGNYSAEQNNKYLDGLEKLRKSHRRDSVILWQISDDIALDKAQLIVVIDSLMSRKPAAVGLDILFQPDTLTAEDSILSNLPKLYDNLVYPYDYSGNVVEYPWGGVFNPIPNMGYVNARKEKGQSEIRYLNLYDKVDGDLRPAFWTQLWLLSRENEKTLQSNRSFINYSLSSFLCCDINNMAIMSEELEDVEGKIIIICSKDSDSRINNDLGIVPVDMSASWYNYDHIMPGPKIICCALQTIIYNEAFYSFWDKNRKIIGLVIIVFLSFLTTALHFCRLRWIRWVLDNLGNTLQIVGAIVLFWMSMVLPIEREDYWYFFSIVALYVIIAPAMDELFRLLGKGAKGRLNIKKSTDGSYL